MDSEQNQAGEALYTYCPRCQNGLLAAGELTRQIHELLFDARFAPDRAPRRDEGVRSTRRTPGVACHAKLVEGSLTCGGLLCAHNDSDLVRVNGDRHHGVRDGNFPTNPGVDTD